MNSSFRQRLKGHATLVGTIVSLASPEVAEVLSAAGFDWLFVDAEHSPLDALAIQRILQGAGATSGLVRLARADEVLIKKALDVATRSERERVPLTNLETAPGPSGAVRYDATPA